MKVLQKGVCNKCWSSELVCSGHGNGSRGCKAVLLVEECDLFVKFSNS